MSRVGAICFALPAFEDCAVLGTALPQAEEYLLTEAADAQSYKVYMQATLDSNLMHEPVTVLLADVFAMLPLSSSNDTKVPAFVCPRNILRTALDALLAEAALSVRVGFELEFLLLDAKSRKPVDSQVYASSIALCKRMDILLAMSMKLEENDIGVLQFHAESAPGQFEIALDHYPALEAADKVTIAKEIIVAEAARHGLIASFMPKASENAAGSGMHCHISLATRPAEHFEVKAFDATANPYVGLAGIIYAGLEGVLAELQLPAPCQEEPSESKGDVRLPTSMTQAVDMLNKDERLGTRLGSELVRTISQLRLREEEFFEHLSIAEQRDHLLERY
ncbi:Type-1 glutamine synthetase 1 [Hondaea fermentalgiana]|uniref:Type-1 glutamine synthetase 1 n=1 Tax=Hondaea fermentalgiana TaxID=2315210 RepID=A0A2R5GIX4_9STRA|nr:Type-1 glutamine synthetase 1 [Hondaea fermentalgiana]|eukprot:GBG28241.1 Type-1 glutamine synthetase 1 [Hondaea fermentalgiana]